MAEPPRAEVLANLLECLETTHQLADADIPVFTSKLFGVIDEWKSIQQQRVDAEAHSLAVLEGLRPTTEELIPFRGVRSRLLQAIPAEITVRRGIFQVEYKEIQEEDVVRGTTAPAILVSVDDTVLPLNADETVAQLAVNHAVPQFVNDDTVTQFANEDTITQAAVDDTVVPSNMDQNATPLVQNNVDHTIPQLAVDDTIIPLDMDQNVTPLVQDSGVPTVEQVSPCSSSPLSVRGRTPTPPSTLSLPPPLSPSDIIPHAQEPSDFSLSVPASEDVVETQGRSSFAPTVPTTGDDVETQGQDSETNYDTAHLYDATPPRAPRASPVATLALAAPDLSEDELTVDNNTVPLMNTRRARAGTAVTRRVTRASRAASNELLWGTPNANSVQVAPPTPKAPATDESSAAQPQQLDTNRERRKTPRVHFERKATRSVTKSSSSQPQPSTTSNATKSLNSQPLQSTTNTASQPPKGAEDNLAPKPIKAAARRTTSQAQPSGPSTNTRRPQGAEVQPAPKVAKPVAKAKAEPQLQQPSTPSSSGRPREIKSQKQKVASNHVGKPTNSKAKKSAAKNSSQESQEKEVQPAPSAAKTVEKSTPSHQPTTKTKPRQSRGTEVTDKLAAETPKKPKAPKTVAKSTASQPEEPIASSSSRLPQVSGPASQLGATPKATAPPAVSTTGGTREMTTNEVKKGRYWVFEHGSTKRRVKLYVLRCPNKDCKNPVFSRHPFKQNRAVEHLRGCTNFRMENATEERIIARFAYHVRSDPTSGPVTREWACRHNSTLIPKTRSYVDLRAENVWEEVEEEEDELAC